MREALLPHFKYKEIQSQKGTHYKEQSWNSKPGLPRSKRVLLLAQGLCQGRIAQEGCETNDHKTPLVYNNKH